MRLSVVPGAEVTVTVSGFDGYLTPPPAMAAAAIEVYGLSVVRGDQPGFAESGAVGIGSWVGDPTVRCRHLPKSATIR